MSKQETKRRETRVTAHCPKCGSDDIRERNVAYTELPVLGWELEDGELRPTDYATDQPADWETEDTDSQYVCRRCCWKGSLDALTVTED